MTTDPFTEAARAEAEAFVRKAMADAWTDGEEFEHLPRVLAERLPEWARAHLAAQEPSDAEVEAAKAVLDSVEYADEPQSIRAALSAARAARRDEEKRDA